MADPSSVTVADQLVVRPRTTRVEGKPVLAKRPAVAYAQGLAPVLELVVRDGEGRAVNLTGLGFSSTNPASSSAAPSESSGTTEGRVLLRLREVLSLTASTPPIEVEGVVWDAPAGVLRFKLPATAGAASGAMIGEVGIFAPDGDLQYTYDLHVLVERGQFGAVVTGRGLPAVDEVRLWMRDNDPNDNFLLKELEFDLAEIVESMVDCVREWNTSMPPVGKTYNTCTFPNPHAMRLGVMGRLYQLAAKHYRRAHLAYSAGGVQLDDKNKAPEYEQVGGLMCAQYTQWVRVDKARINRENWTGTFGSGYGGRR